MKRFIQLALITGLLWVSGCGSDNSQEKEPILLTTEEKGKKIYRKFCIQCHGYDGTLMASGSKNLKESTLTQEERITFVKKGRGAMIAYEGILSEQEIQWVSEYVESFKP
jgi:mono/diheme cytochrome c family protein